MPTLRTCTAAALLLAAAACERDAAAAPDALVVRDSAGIEIIENRDLGWAAGEGWRLADTPEVDIGVLEGDPMYQLFHVAAATRMSDGRVAVALAGSHEIRIYGPDGAFLQTAGREGEGPGEFRSLRGLWSVRGDSLLAWDDGLRRITLLDPAGSVARQSTVAGNPSNAVLLKPFSDGRMILMDERFDFPTTGMRDQMLELTLHAPTGEFEDSVGRFVFAHMGFIGGPESRMFGSAAFAPRTDIVSSGDRLIVGDGAAPEISFHDPADGLSRIVRWPDGDRVVTDADIARYRDEELAGIEDENYRRARRTYLDDVPYDRQFPVYDRIVATADDGVWVRSYRRPGSADSATWIVIDSAGRRLGEVSAPRGLWIFEIGSDYVIGRELDDFDVEHVRLYRLVKE